MASGKMSVITGLWDFMRVRKKWWLGPIVGVLLMLGLLLIFTQGSASTTFTVGATGSVTPSPVPTGLRLIVEVYAQANARVN